MPELPEVEMVKRGLETLVINQTIVHITTDRKTMFPQGFSYFKEQVEQKEIQAIERFGKYLLFILNQGIIVSHLRMEGKYSYTKDMINDSYVHVVFQLEDGFLNYRDVRTFGRFIYAKDKNEVNALLPKGQDPTHQAFDMKKIQAQLGRLKSPIKNVLLNQKIIAGLGNIYVDEVLFRAHIHPLRPANTLTRKEIATLLKQTALIFQEAIACGGTTIRTYKNAFGQEGTFQNHLLVYGKEGSPCSCCGTTIEKIKVGGRGTHFCPQCQK